MASAQDVLISLPVDNLIDIISCLDPVSLIALSQTSKGLRDFINPLEHDFQQRLLALEPLPKNGGPEPDDYPGYPFRHPRFRLLHEAIPQMTNRGRDWWASSRYACFGCRKLLSNAMFDDSELFNTATRKPWMRSSEVQKMALTDWKLATTTESRLSSIQRRAEQDRELTEQYRQQYQTSFDWIKAVNRELNDDEDVEEVRRKCENGIEETSPHIVGKARHERRCVECKFQRHLYRDRPAHQLLCGNTDAPIIFSRKDVGLGLDFNRLFPGLLPKVLVPPKLKRILAHLCSMQEWHSVDEPLHPDILKTDSEDAEPEDVESAAEPQQLPLRVRCPSCEKWQPTVAFGMIVLWPFRHFSQLRLDHQGSPLCHYCHVKAHGKAATAARLYQPAEKIIDTEIYLQLDHLAEGWEQNLGLIRKVMAKTDLEGTWNKLVTLHDDLDSDELRRALDWSALGPSPTINLKDRIEFKHIHTLSLRKRLARDSLVPFWDRINGLGTAETIFGLHFFLEQWDGYDIRQQSVIHMNRVGQAHRGQGCR